MSTFTRRAVYSPRHIRAAGPIEHHGWRLKRYDISSDGGPISMDNYRSGLDLALMTLPSPAITTDRPGVGFVILHPGASLLYLVLGWWDNQNELITRVFVSDPAAPRWEDAAGRYSFCVWDLEVISFERREYVTFVMSTPSGPDVEAYLGELYPGIPY